MGFPGGSAVKNLLANARDAGLIPGLGRSPEEGNGTQFQYSCLGNSMDRRAWQPTYSPWGHRELDVTERLNNRNTLSHRCCGRAYVVCFDHVDETHFSQNIFCCALVWNPNPHHTPTLQEVFYQTSLAFYFQHLKECVGLFWVRSFFPRKVPVNMQMCGLAETPGI